MILYYCLQRIVQWGDRLDRSRFHWLVQSLITGAAGVAQAASKTSEAEALDLRFPWESDFLYFTFREPFPSNTTGTSLIFSKVTPEQPLVLESQMGENGIIFSDGIKHDFLHFNSGTKAAISLAARKGRLII